VRPEPSEAAEYVLGLLGKEDRRAFARRLSSDEALRAQVEYWESMFADLPADEPETPPPGMFEKILARIEGEGADLPGTMTRRAGSANWFEISPGIKGRLLHVDRAQNRQYLLIRMAPGASYHPHAHDTDEQSLVLEGDLSFGDLNLKAGDFHVATPSSSHPPGRTVNGCLVHVVMSLDQH
jgi:anti-sigma factor ChrR (cupin superfamily)